MNSRQIWFSIVFWPLCILLVLLVNQYHDYKLQQRATDLQTLFDYVNEHPERAPNVWPTPADNPKIEPKIPVLPPRVRPGSSTGDKVGDKE